MLYAHQLVDQDEYLYNGSDLSLWSTIECGVALTASCLATLKPLFRKMNMVFTTTRAKSSSSISASHFGDSGLGGSGLSSERHTPGAPPVSILAGHHRHKSNLSTYAPRRMSGIRRPSKGSISLPTAVVRWSDRLEGDQIEMIPRSLDSDVQSMASVKDVYPMNQKRDTRNMV